MARKSRDTATPDDSGLFPELNRARYGDDRRKGPLFLSRILNIRANHEYGLLTEQQKKAHEILVRWADLETSGKLRRLGEQDLKAEFQSQVFGEALGYVLFSDDKDHWELRAIRYPLPSGQEADGAIGLFSKGGHQPPAAVMEFKGPTANLDRDKDKGRTPVQQCWDYLNDVPDCPWGIVCNYVSIRLYHRNHTPGNYELFTLQELRDLNRFREFLLVFDRQGLLPGPLGAAPRAEQVLKESLDRQEVVGKELYKRYHENRRALIAHLMSPEHGKDLDGAIGIAQTLLDRVIFIAFCQGWDLVPANALAKTKDVNIFSRAQNPQWDNFLDLFRSMDEGNPRAAIPPFNGGLFAHRPEVDELKLDDRWTEFFVGIGKYNFRDEVNVDVLGRIFEQSITDVEAIRADPTMLEKTPKVSGRRKHEGIYYTPRKYTRHIVENTLAPCIEERFGEIRRRHGLEGATEPPAGKTDSWIACQSEMLQSLHTLRVCDPACGSGAFLIQAFDYLEDRCADLIHNLCQASPQNEAPMLAESRATILRENLFGVDLSSEAVEIARLALWIRTAEKGKTLADLSHNILCGNSIVENAQADPAAFDWHANFAQVFAEGGFDCIIGNPPYIKLQNFRHAHPKVAAYLVDRYRSAKTGNFDMYLPFIERGLELLRPGGRLGFIAPSVWLYNEYGQGLRDLILEGRSLERFVDFKSFQAFEDATNYTALQFFRKAPCESITAFDAPDGDLESHPSYPVNWKCLSSGAWSFSPPAVNGIMETMMAKSVTLAEASGGIIVGIQTSADSIYHLIRLGPGKYYSQSLGEVVELEDEIMRPLVSGREAVPFAIPPTEKYLLLPYAIAKAGCPLLSVKEMSGRFRRTWDYLRRNEKALRARERGKMDHDQWYAYNYPKNLDKQALPKLLVPRLLLNLFASSDPGGKRCIDNVDVGGVITENGGDLFYLLGVLNSHAADFFWRQTSKPFRGDYRSANKQFIAPLPVPKVGTREQKPVANIAESLADLHGKRLAAIAKIHRRFVVDMAPRELGTGSPLPPPLPRRLQAFSDMPIADSLVELARFAKRKLRPTERDEWDNYLTKESGVIAKVNRRIENLTAELNDRVNSLYGLSAAQAKTIIS